VQIGLLIVGVTLIAAFLNTVPNALAQSESEARAKQALAGSPPMLDDWWLATPAGPTRRLSAPTHDDWALYPSVVAEPTSVRTEN
jgi:hypothetical protein